MIVYEHRNTVGSVEKIYFTIIEDEIHFKKQTKLGLATLKRPLNDISLEKALKICDSLAKLDDCFWTIEIS